MKNVSIVSRLPMDSSSLQVAALFFLLLALTSKIVNAGLLSCTCAQIVQVGCLHHHVNQLQSTTALYLKLHAECGLLGTKSAIGIKATTLIKTELGMEFPALS